MQPGALTTISFTSPSWNTIAFWRWSTVNSALDTSSATTASDGDDGAEGSHQRSPRSRLRSDSRERGPASAGGSGAARGGAASAPGAPAFCMILSSGR